MEADTYSNAAVIEFSNRRFINVSVFLDAPSAVAREFAVESIPATFLVGPGGERVRKWEGYLGPEDYKRGLEQAVEAHGKLKAVELKLKADPGSYSLNREAGGFYSLLSQSRAAADALKKAAAQAPDAKSRAVLLARVLGELYEVEISDALNTELLEVASELERTDPDGQFGLRGDALAGRAQVALNRERRDEAVRLFEEVVEKHPASARAPVSLLWLADLYHHHQKDNAKALRALETLLEKYPKSDVVGDAREMLEHLKKHP